MSSGGAPASPNASPDADPRPWCAADAATGRSLWLATSRTDGSGGGDQRAAGFSGEGDPEGVAPLDCGRDDGGCGGAGASVRT